MDRRNFIRNSLIGSIGAVAAANSIFSAPEILTKSRTARSTAAGELLFKPVIIQKGMGPHIYDLVWTTDNDWDTFYSNISLTSQGIKLSDTKGKRKFGINARWNVEGFGYTNITADNGGEFYELPPNGKLKEYILQFEFAKSRIVRNEKRIELHSRNGWQPASEISGLHSLSRNLFEDASKIINDTEKCARLAQQSLMYALWAGEKLELDKANFEIEMMGKRNDFFIGCDARAFYQMDQDIFLENFVPLFNYANITFVPQSNNAVNRDFEPQMGKHNYAIRDHLIDTLAQHGIKSQGRLLYWYHDCCMPDWMRGMSYDSLLKYVERNTKEVLEHFGDRMYAWEMVNELHDWANEFHLVHNQINELTGIITNAAKAAVPNVKRTINNCCPFAEYVGMKRYSGSAAVHPQRTPIQFTRDILAAGIDIDIIEQQMYFPYRDLQDTIMLIERYEEFGKPMHISEIGCPGGPTEYSVKMGSEPFPPGEPYLWHHHWDEETQGDWLEQFYTLIYSKPYIKAGNWFDFVEPHSYMQNGALLKNIKGEKKASYHRFKKVVDRFI
ncbi:MAG: endo-1,4-beta-xylanase [Melioribacteraceae bacterium]|nr:endo-1,4-beta-xylanase [Melioribacteraceae bacterium]MCF8353524.1 endo-1,4-beta-xylanase [Melioribacteraceae bacterium]MCF8392542.1 endo-1,4-beta-xylanase [Melioribacteraceae bacterium]MCF8418443.1 endo-1,4-beta-xylanase [Melioribacteraceae bacterium]